MTVPHTGAEDRGKGGLHPNFVPSLRGGTWVNLATDRHVKGGVNVPFPGIGGRVSSPSLLGCGCSQGTPEEVLEPCPPPATWGPPKMLPRTQGVRMAQVSLYEGLLRQLDES